MPDVSDRSTTRAGFTTRVRRGIASRIGRTARADTRSRAVSVPRGNTGLCTCTEPLTDELIGAQVLGGADDGDDGADFCWRCHRYTGSDE